MYRRLYYISMQGVDELMITSILNDFEISGNIIFETIKYDKDFINLHIDKMFNCINSQSTNIQGKTVAIALDRGIDYAIADLMAL